MIQLDGNALTLKDLVQIARHHEKISIDEKSKKLIQQASLFVEDVVKHDQAVYGINTGFGHLAHVKINKNQVEELQINLLKSHACGVGEPLPIEVVRAMMTLRINALIKGYSGITLETILKLAEYLNENIIPVVFEKGSLGASGDLALLSHMSLPLVGLGEVYYQNERLDTMKALEKANIKPLPKLKAKEGLSLINGTQGMSAIGGLVLYDAMNLLKIANLSLSLTMEALGGVMDAYHPVVHQIRNQNGQIDVAKEVVENLKGSQHVTKQNEMRVQDAYSLRCAPQVHGASL
ncbi:MAG: aromatic amino acid lyase, partial [Acholeplasmataceae bacterium]|nr:aromatic amino acid lyase [Acholeplasmataceae bacterium]